MRCDAARRLLSDRLDQPIGPDDEALVDEHLRGCQDCRAFHHRLDRLRRHLALAPVGGAPDVAPRVRSALEMAPRKHAAPQPAARAPLHRPRRPRAAYAGQVAAVFLISFGLAAAVIGVAGPPTAQATDVAELVAEAQTRLRALEATVEITEHSWHRDVPVRRYTGRLAYAAVETLSLRLDDVTTYPTDAWRPNDIEVVVADDRSWTVGRAGCPAAGLPGCTPEQPRTDLAGGREPFDPARPVPLDLVLPVASFVVSGAEEPLGTGEVAGRSAIGVEVTAAQVSPLLDAVLQVGNWRPIHPTDRARVWLDAQIGVPLTVEVSVAGGFERDRWAAANGLDEDEGDPVLAWHLQQVRVNPAEPPEAPPQPSGEPDDLGFRDGTDAHAPTPSWLPDGMQAHRSGRVGDVEVTSWSDGAAWLKVRSTMAWRGGRLFGQDDAVVRRIDLGEAGLGYLAEGGRRLHVHGDCIDVEVSGSVAHGVLVRVAASLGIVGRAVPPDWAEASSATTAEAATLMPGLLVLPDGMDGFAGPAVTIADATIVLAYSGGGSRAFTLAQSRTDVLGPPVDDVVMSIEVRGTTGRYTPDRGSLEWVEQARVVTLRSRTLSLNELLAIARELEVVQ